MFLLNYAGIVPVSPSSAELKRMQFPRNTGKSLPKYQLLKKSYVKALDKIASLTNTPVIDIEALFDTPESRKVFTDSVHFNVEGAEVIGSKVTEAILPCVK